MKLEEHDTSPSSEASRDSGSTRSHEGSQNGELQTLKEWRELYAHTASSDHWQTVHRWENDEYPFHAATDIRQKLNLQPSDRVLEVGCASGQLLALVLTDNQSGLGLDHCQEVLRRGRDFLPQGSRIELAVADASHLPIPSNSFDAVFIYSVSQCFPSDAYAAAVVGELIRVCRRGGLILIGDVFGTMEKQRRRLCSFGVPQRAADALLLPLRPLWRWRQTSGNGDRLRRRSYSRRFFLRAATAHGCAVEFLMQNVPGRAHTKARFDVRIVKPKTSLFTKGGLSGVSASSLTNVRPPRVSASPLTKGGPRGVLGAASKQVQLFGIPFDALRMNDVVAHLETAIDTSGHVNISVVNVAKLVNMQRDPLLRESVLAGDLIVADGMPLVWVGRLKRTPLPERVAGIDLMFELFKLADERCHRVYFLGAEAEVLQRVIDIARRDYPRMQIAGHHHGYFSQGDEESVVAGIRTSNADILFVAMTSPRKELFMKRWEESLNVKICHGVGGSFDVMAGKTRRAPQFMQRLGLEWLYRVIQEPRRMWKRYLVTNSLFVVMTIRELFSRRSSIRRHLDAGS